MSGPNGARSDAPAVPLDPQRYAQARDELERALQALRHTIENDATVTSIRFTLRFARGGTRVRRPFENLTVETLAERRPS